MALGTKLNFSLHLKNVKKKGKKKQDTLARTSLSNIFKSFKKSHLDYGDINHERAYNTSFHQNIESIPYNAVVSITSTVRGTSTENLYQELGFQFLQQRCWYRKLFCSLKIINNQSPCYLARLVTSESTKFFAQNSENFSQFRTKRYFFKNSFFSSTIKEWNNLDLHSENSKTLVFSKAIFKNSYRLNEAKCIISLIL